MDFLDALEISLSTEKHLWIFNEEAHSGKKHGYTFVHVPTETAILLEVLEDDKKQISFIEVMLVQGVYRQLANTANQMPLELPEDSEIYANLMEVRDVEKLFEYVDQTSNLIGYVISKFKQG